MNNLACRQLTTPQSVSLHLACVHKPEHFMVMIASTTELSVLRTKNGFPLRYLALVIKLHLRFLDSLHHTKNCDRRVPMISGHETVCSMGFQILGFVFEWIPTNSCRQDIGRGGKCRLWAVEFSAGQDFHLFDKTLSFEKPMFTGWSIQYVVE